MIDKSAENQEKEIARYDLLTPREIESIGGTREEEWSEEDEDVPIAIINGESVERVAQLRKEQLAQFTSDILGFAAGYDKTLVIQFCADLDLETGKVLGELRFIGLWNKQTEQSEPAADPDKFDREVKERLSKFKKAEK